jgi:hypothetical protein
MKGWLEGLFKDTLMKRSTEHPATHTGSLPSADLTATLGPGRRNHTSPRSSMPAYAELSLMVRKQVEAGVDIISDGERAKSATPPNPTPSNGI